MPASGGKSSVQSLKAEETPGYSCLERCSLFLKSRVTMDHLQMWIQKQLKNIQVEQWHQADISRESKQGFPIALHHTLESSLWFPAWLPSSGTRQILWNFSQLLSTAVETAPWVNSSLLNHSFPVLDLRNFCLMLLSQKSYSFWREKKNICMVQIYGLKY